MFFGVESLDDAARHGGFKPAWGSRSRRSGSACPAPRCCGRRCEHARRRALAALSQRRPDNELLPSSRARVLSAPAPAQEPVPSPPVAADARHARVVGPDNWRPGVVGPRIPASGARPLGDRTAPAQYSRYRRPRPLPPMTDEAGFVAFPAEFGRRQRGRLALLDRRLVAVIARPPGATRRSLPVPAGTLARRPRPHAQRLALPFARGRRPDAAHRVPGRRRRPRDRGRGRAAGGGEAAPSLLGAGRPGVVRADLRREGGPRAHARSAEPRRARIAPARLRGIVQEEIQARSRRWLRWVCTPPAMESPRRSRHGS